MATTNDLKNGMVLNIDGQLWSVVEFQHVKPGKGPAFVRTKLKNVTSGKTVDKTFNAGTKVETSNVDKRTMQYLYNDGTDFVFMDPDTYDQIPVAPEVVGDAAKYMLENQEAVIARHDGSVLYVELPASVVLEITYTEPGLQATARPVAPSRPPSRPAPRSPSRSSSSRHQGQGRHPRRLLPRSSELSGGTHQGASACRRPALRGRVPGPERE